MAKDAKSTREKLKRRRSGHLFRYTLAFSVAAHFGVWALVGWPGGPPAQRAAFGSQEDRTKVHVTLPYDNLPPPPSLEYAEPPRMPEGIPGKGDLGEIPMPVPDKYAEANTIPDARVRGVGPFLDPGSRLTVETPGAAIEGPVSASPERIEIVPTSKAPAIIYRSRPAYPDIARDSRVEGDVVLLIYIDAQGDVRNAVVQSSPGLPALEEAATEAAYKCKFKAAEQQGAPVGVWYSLVMQFRL